MTIVYDLKLRRPACVNLQAIYGGSAGVGVLFPPECWLIGPTPDMKCYLISPDELARLVEYHGGSVPKPTLARWMETKEAA